MWKRLLNSFYLKLTLWKNVFLNKDKVKIYQLQFLPEYWDLINKQHNLKIFQQKCINSLSKFGEFIKSPIILAIILVFLFQIIDYTLNISKIFSLYLSQLNFIHIIISSNYYNGILTTLTEVSGVFIGLYLTAISVVLSSAYVKVPENVRSLFLKQTMGKYPKIVVSLGSVTLILMLFNALNIQPSILNLFLVVILGLISIFSFLYLVGVVFRLFNPNGLINYIMDNLFYSIQSVTINGSQWDNPINQFHEQQKAESLLKTYLDIVKDVTNNKKLEGEAINELAFHGFNILIKYTYKKFLIPIESRWFRLNPKYPNWLAINALDSSQIDLAVQTKTTISPEEVNDPMWFEEKISLIVDLSLKTHLQRKDFKSAILLMEYSNNVIIIQSKNLATSESITLLHKFDEIINLKTNEEYKSKDLIEREQFYFKIKLIDIYAIGYLNIIKGFHESFRSFDSRHFSELIKKIDWDNDKSLYEFKFNLNVLKQLFEIQKGLKFEKKVEGSIISPNWYQIQLAALGLARFFDSTLEELFLELDNFLDNLKILIDNKQYIFAAQFVQRGLELCDNFQIDNIKIYFNEISKLRKVEDIPWPKIDWSEYEKKLEKVKRYLLVNLGMVLVELIQIPNLDNLPDYFGQSYTFVTEECFNSLIENDEALFMKLFPSFFLSSLSAPNKLSELSLQYLERDINIIKIEPIINLLEMSGYAIIFSELYDKNYWNFTKDLWDEHLTNSENSDEIIKLLNELSSYHPFKITQQQLMRTKWEQRLKAKLIDQLNISEQEKFEGVKTEHPKPIINYLLQQGLFYIGLMEVRKIFISKYLITRTETKEIEINPQIQHLIDYLAEFKK